jgi:transcriptional regulator with XRE-family HTH domain
MPELKGASRDPDAICFGLIVKRLRMQRGWTLQQLGRATGLHPNYLGVMERGGNSPSIQSLIQISHTLGVHAADVMREIVDTREQFRKRAPAKPEEPAAEES